MKYILLNASNTSNASADSFLKLITVLFIFVFVLLLTYLTTRWMAGFQKNRASNKNLRVIETISVGNNKFISIVEAGTEYLVVSVGKEEVNLLTTLEKEQLKDLSFLNDTSQGNNESFKKILDKFKDSLPKTKK